MPHSSKMCGDFVAYRCYDAKLPPRQTVHGTMAPQRAPPPGFKSTAAGLCSSKHPHLPVPVNPRLLALNYDLFHCGTVGLVSSELG